MLMFVWFLGFISFTLTPLGVCFPKAPKEVGFLVDWFDNIDCDTHTNLFPKTWFVKGSSIYLKLKIMAYP